MDVGNCFCLLAGLLCVDYCFCTNCVSQNIKQVDNEMEEIARCNQSNVTSSRVLIARSSVLQYLLVVVNNGLIDHVAPIPSF